MSDELGGGGGTMLSVEEEKNMAITWREKKRLLIKGTVMRSSYPTSVAE